LGAFFPKSAILSLIARVSAWSSFLVHFTLGPLGEEPFFDFFFTVVPLLTVVPLVTETDEGDLRRAFSVVESCFVLSTFAFGVLTLVAVEVVVVVVGFGCVFFLVISVVLLVGVVTLTTVALGLATLPEGCGVEGGSFLPLVFVFTLFDGLIDDTDDDTVGEGTVVNDVGAGGVRGVGVDSATTRDELRSVICTLRNEVEEELKESNDRLKGVYNVPPRKKMSFKI